MKFIPLGDRVVVKPELVEEITKGGIIIPDTVGQASQAPTTGTIIAVGPGRYADIHNTESYEMVDNETGKTTILSQAQPIPMSVKVDDVVMWTKFAGSNITIEGIDCVIMHESDLIGIIDPDGKGVMEG